MKDYNDKSGLAYYWLEANAGRLLLAILFAFLGVWGLLLEGRDDLDLGRRLVRGMGPELAGIVIVAVTINALNERRQRDNRKAQLIRQLGSKYRDVTEVALLELKHEGWLYDGTLRRAFLAGANLNGANLWGADLRGVNLDEANLSEAELETADLSGAKLRKSKMSKGKLNGIRLHGADLYEADLSGTSMWFADLRKAKLSWANLKGAALFRANLSESDLSSADLNSASLIEANLEGVRLLFWQTDQFDEPGRMGRLSGAIMPDGIQLGQKGIGGIFEHIEGPSFKEWKKQYLAKSGISYVEVIVGYEYVSEDDYSGSEDNQLNEQ